MQPSSLFYLGLVLVLILFMSTKAEDQLKPDKYTINKTIIVDQAGHGNFTEIQKAIDSIPSNNKDWTLVHVKAGIYNEKVNIPTNKPNIVLQGESKESTIIQFGDSGDSIKSSTFSFNAGDFVAMDITFKNTHNLEPGKPIIWAPAALINGDKATFYRCEFVSVQDTLTDSQGRHYYENCYIQGAIDFIWGNGKSIFQQCTLNVTSLPGGVAGYITAQARDSMNVDTGFVFKDGSIVGTGSAYLGRAYRPYSRVLFYRMKMDNIIVPEGWSAWESAGKEENIVFAEEDCEGPGANKSKRVPWEKTLSPGDLNYLSNISSFLGTWIQEQPIPNMVS